MPLIEFVNPNQHSVHLMGPDKKVIVVGGKQKVVLQDWFSRYAPNFIRPVRGVERDSISVINPNTRPQIQVARATRPKIPTGIKGIRVEYANRAVKILNERHGHPRQPTNIRNHGPTVGKTTFHGEVATKYFQMIIPSFRICLSNDIGVGILSYNRLGSIQRLLASIATHTNLQRTTVFVSDESSQPEVKQWLRTVDWIVLLDNQERLGVAGNTNRLIQCLDRFRHKIILNDDVEILAKGWEQFYPVATAESGIHHFCFRQLGVYGAAKTGVVETRIKSRLIKSVHDKPQGAVIAYDDAVAKVAGFMDESMGLYGMEHVDWSNRVSLSGIQPRGFHDVEGSEQFFRLHNESSAVEGRVQLLLKARELWESVKTNPARIHVQRTPRSDVPSISCIIPCRGLERQKSVDAVIACVKGQNFPAIEILVVEQDETEKIRLSQFARKLFIRAPREQPFCKAVAFNKGVAETKHLQLVLQDGDIIFHRDYLKKLISALKGQQGVHIGKEVIYMDGASTNEIISQFRVSESLKSSQVVGYFEGGSLACTKQAFFACGGFLEEFIGYGCEDCDFFNRLKNLGKFFDVRTEAFIHLDHGRPPGWKEIHTKNKKLFANLKIGHDMTQLSGYCRGKLRTAGYGPLMDSLGT